MRIQFNQTGEPTLVRHADGGVTDRGHPDHGEAPPRMAGSYVAAPRGHHDPA